MLPTPLHEVPKFSAAIGGPRIFIKRDDLTGLAFGGNKTRMFEFLLAKARAEGADTVVGGAGVQSNYARQLVAACNSMGFEIHLVLRYIRGPKDNDIQGNLLLDLLAGASVHVINASGEEQRRAMYDLAEKLKKKGKKPFVARMASDEELTPDVIAYVNCFCEIVEQCKELEIVPSSLYLASYDSTQAGLELSIAALRSSIRIVGIAPAVWESDASELIARYANQAAEKLTLNCRIKKEDVFNTTDYVGERYGIPTQAGIDMIKLMARTEGIFLDPVYTSKAMSALYDHVKKGKVSSKDVVIFLHTGGTPALFAYQEELGMEELRRHLVID
ncbi:L-cysteate sulfo-lyase [subsurface metagenome]